MTDNPAAEVTSTADIGDLEFVFFTEPVKLRDILASGLMNMALSRTNNTPIFVQQILDKIAVTTEPANANTNGECVGEDFANLPVPVFTNLTLEGVLARGFGEMCSTSEESDQFVGAALDQIALKSAKLNGYWYRRAEFAETALEPFANAFIPAFDQAAMNLITTDDVRQAHRVMAERRKGQLENFEDFIRDRRQTKVYNWAVKTFTRPDFDPVEPMERARRFMEEAVELVDSAYCKEKGIVLADDLTSERANYLITLFYKLLDRITTKPPGELRNEIGGVMITLLCLAEVHKESVAACEKDEFSRVLSVPQSHFQARHDEKRAQGL